MTNGLKIAPKNAKRTGSMFGNGIYFADTFQKAAVYSFGNSEEGNEDQYLLLCEVALGKTLNTLVFGDSRINPDQLQCDSI